MSDNLAEQVKELKKRYSGDNCQPISYQAYYKIRPLLREKGFELIQEGLTPKQNQPIFIGAVHARRDYGLNDELLVEIDVLTLQPGLSYLKNINRYYFTNKLQERLQIDTDLKSRINLLKNTALTTSMGLTISGVFLAMGSSSPLFLIPPILLGGLGYAKDQHDSKIREKQANLITQQYLKMLTTTKISTGWSALEKALR